MKLIIAEKPSIAKSIVSTLGAKSESDGCFRGNGLIVSRCAEYLISHMDAVGYDERFKRWCNDDLLILPEPFTMCWHLVRRTPRLYMRLVSAPLRCELPSPVSRRNSMT